MRPLTYPEFIDKLLAAKAAVQVDVIEALKMNYPGYYDKYLAILMDDL